MPLIKEKNMKKLIVPLMLLLLAACGQKGIKVQETVQTDTLKQEQLALIDFPEGDDFDFGTYNKKEKKTHDFLVRNPGKVPLVISKVEAACGCTQVIGPQKPILEGQTDTIHVIYDGNGFTEGFWVKHIRIYANIVDGSRDLSIHGSYFDNQ